MTVNTRNVSLSQTCVLGSKKPDVSVSSVGERYKIDPTTRQRTDVLDGYYVNVYSSRGEVQTVKLGVNVADKIEEIKKAVEQNKVVQVNFNKTFKAKFYAMIIDSRLMQGISASATDIQIVSVEDAVFDDFDTIDY
jgi:hypothetical protein